jgi:hypothetical protein
VARPDGRHEPGRPGAGGGVTSTWRSWGPDLAVGAVVAFLGLFEAATTHVYEPESRLPLVFLAIGVAATVTVSRQAPGVALALVWGVCALQVLGDVPVMVAQLSIAAVAFCTARWGSTTTVWLSAMSIPLAAGIAVWFVSAQGPGLLIDKIGNRGLVDNIYQLGYRWQVLAGVVGAAVLAAPWLAGLAFRWPGRGPRRPRRWPPSRTRPGPTSSPSRPARSPGCARSRPGWPATCTTSWGTRSR